MSFSVKMKKMKSWTNGRQDKARNNVQVRVGTHKNNTSKAVFYIHENNAFVQDYYIPVEQCSIGGMNMKKDNSSYIITFKMDENTNDYKCMFKGSQKNLQQLLDYKRNFTASVLNQIRNNAKKSENKKKRKNISVFKNTNNENSNNMRSFDKKENNNINKKKKTTNSRKAKTNASKYKNNIKLPINKSPPRNKRPVNTLSDQQKTPPQANRNSLQRKSSKKTNLNAGNGSYLKSSTSRSKQMLMNANKQNNKRASACPPMVKFDNYTSQNSPPALNRRNIFTNVSNSNKNFTSSASDSLNQFKSTSYSNNNYRNNAVFKSSITPCNRGGGIKNLGNTCYMNAVLQSIFSCSGFIRDMKRKCLTKAATKGIELKQNRLMYCGMISFLKQMNHALGEKKAVDPTKTIRQAVCKIFSNFNNSTQQDAHEFFVGVLNRIHEELLLCKVVPPLSSSKHDVNIVKPSKQNKKSKNKTTAWMKKWLDTDKITDERNFEYLPTTRHFHIEIDNSLKCQNTQCLFTRSKLELFRNLSLYLPQKQQNRSLTITELLDSYFNNEVVELRCEKCSKVGACKATKLHALPKVLVLHFKRFEANPMTGLFNKRRDNIEIDNVIDLSTYVYVYIYIYIYSRPVLI
jgi:ubiquitin C-terminal hydrolase